MWTYKNMDTDLGYEPNKIVIRALYCILMYQLYHYFGYTIDIVSFILVTRYFKRYIFV